MASQENIIKLLPEHLHNVAMNFSIPEDMLQNNTDLVVLVLESKSISEPKEKQSWFDLYSLMNQEWVLLLWLLHYLKTMIIKENTFFKRLVFSIFR